jgi:hypothetical protein
VKENVAKQDRHLLYILDLAGLRAYSFSGINFSQTCSHLIHTRFPFVPAAGLRLEIALNIDKEKSELYFSFSVKKILTEKPNRACPQAMKISPSAQRMSASAHAGISFASSRC